MMFNIWLISTFIIFFYCLVQWIRTPQSEAGKHGYQDDRDWWLVGAFCSFAWPATVLGYLIVKLWKGFEKLVLHTFGPVQPKQMLNEQPVPDTLLEKFTVLEQKVRQEERIKLQATCPHHYGHDVTTLGDSKRIRICHDCGISLEYMWGGQSLGDQA